MNEISPANAKLLRQLCLPASQQLFIEKMWREDPPKESESSFMRSALVNVICLAAAAIMLSLCFSAQARPYGNIALTIIWVFAIVIMPLVSLLMLVIILATSGKDKKELLTPGHLAMIKPSPMIRRIYS